MSIHRILGSAIRRATGAGWQRDPDRLHCGRSTVKRVLVSIEAAATLLCGPTGDD